MLSNQEYKFLNKLINKLNVKEKVIEGYPLLENAFTKEDILSGIEVLLSRQLTMSEITYKFEKYFAKFIGSKYALMVNSGSSANLLASFALINPKKKNRVKSGDSFLIPALCWSTSLWPLVQCGLKPVFIDINNKNFCLDDQRIDNKILNKVRVILTIHILGNSSNIMKISKIAKKKEIFLIEDTCESLGSKYGSKYLGTFGDFGTYSFYYSHQITSGEGGMIVCNSKEDYNIICSLRSHGWDRMPGQKKKTHHSSFNFINSGFNVRPMDVNAAIGYSQFKRLNNLIKIRSKNRLKIIKKLENSHKWDNQFEFFYSNTNVKPSFFGFPILINKKYLKRKKNFLKMLNSKKIETRPIISGNFLNQPCTKLYKFGYKKENFTNAQEVEDRGFFIGIPSKPLSESKLDYLVENLLNI